jgi:hypothetical protein
MNQARKLEWEFWKSKRLHTLDNSRQQDTWYINIFLVINFFSFIIFLFTLFFKIIFILIFSFKIQEFHSQRYFPVEKRFLLATSDSADLYASACPYFFKAKFLRFVSLITSAIIVEKKGINFHRDFFQIKFIVIMDFYSNLKVNFLL